MPKIDHDTKEKILAAAEKVFHRNGFKGTRTTLIAEEAGISRTMLHYYYSTKEALFEAVLSNTLGTVFAHFNRLTKERDELDKILGNLIEVLSDVLEEKPDLPSFIVNILNEAPAMLTFLPVTEQDDLPAVLDRLLTEGKAKGEVAQNVTGEDLVMNIYALCSIPYLVAPYVKQKENRSEAAMEHFIRQRRQKVLSFVLKGIKP
jgi:TetR/AcrR family transcriptional regulator